MTDSASGHRRAPIRDAIGLPFTIFRASDAVELQESGAMHDAGPSDADAVRVEAMQEADAQSVQEGVASGSRARLMFSRPGMSLSYVWFKSGFPLPRHSHDADCLYFIVAGSLRFGEDELGPGDGFFVGKDVPYAYVPGEAGVEVLEFRNAAEFDIKLLANNPTWWNKALARLVERKPVWDAEEAAPPSGITVGD